MFFGEELFGIHTSKNFKMDRNKLLIAKSIGGFWSIIFYILILLSNSSCGNGEEAIIKGAITNIDYSYILASHLSSDTIVIDTIFLNNRGKFRYSKKIDTLTIFSLYMNNYESAAVVFAENGDKLKVTGDALLPDLIRVNGNEINDDLTSFKIANQDVLKQRAELLLNLQIDSIRDTPTENSLKWHNEIENLNLLNHELTIKAEEYIIDNPTKLSSLILINNFFIDGDNPQALDRVLGHVDGEVTQTEIAAKLYEYSKKLNRSAEGAYLPYFQLINKNEKAVEPKDFKGQYLLLSFISTFGIESRETVELLKDEYAELKNDKVAFISIYIDSDIYPIEYLEQDSIPWIVVPEERGWGSDIVDIFNLNHIPFNILISPDGIIKTRNISAREVSKMIKKSSDS